MEYKPGLRIGDLPDLMACDFGAREGLRCGATSYTFHEIAAHVDQAAKGFIALGIGKGDHVALWLNNRAEWIYCLFALAKIGAVIVPVNTRFRVNDLTYVLRQSNARALIAQEHGGTVDYLSLIREAVSLPATGDMLIDPDFPSLRHVVLLGDGPQGGCVLWESLLQMGTGVSDAALSEAQAAVSADDPVIIMYTSGTTGFPKGVMHNHSLLDLLAERVAALKLTDKDVILNYLPLFHVFGLTEAALASMLTGARQVLTETFDGDESVRLIESEGASVMHGFDTHMKDLVDAQERLGCDVSSLRTGIFSAGMHSSEPIVRRGLQILAPLKSVTGYGMSELGVGAMLGSLDDTDDQRCAASGQPFGGYECRIVDPETGRDQSVGEPGEILMRGPGLMLGYYQNEEATRASYDADGWFHTGDMGCWRDDGYVRFLGRYKDMLKVGGENVDPAEVEALLASHEHVQAATVVGLPDPRLAEVAVAYICLKPGGEADSDAILDYCRGKIASFKLPRYVFFMDELPMTPSGKVIKVELRGRAEQDAAAAQAKAEAEADAEPGPGIEPKGETSVWTRVSASLRSALRI